MFGGEKLRLMGLLFGGCDYKKLGDFFRYLEEQIMAGAADAYKAYPTCDTPELKAARGYLRRHKTNEAALRAAQKHSIEAKRQFSAGKSASFALVRVGAFNVVPTRAKAAFRGSPRALATRPIYLQELCKNNGFLDPQMDLLMPEPSIISPGSLGGALAVEYEAQSASVPSFVGLIVPSPDLKKSYQSLSLGEIRAYLRAELQKTRAVERKNPTRKLPQLKRKSGEQE